MIFVLIALEGDGFYHICFAWYNFLSPLFTGITIFFEYALGTFPNL